MGWAIVICKVWVSCVQLTPCYVDREFPVRKLRKATELGMSMTQNWIKSLYDEQNVASVGSLYTLTSLLIINVSRNLVTMIVLVWI